MLVMYGKHGECGIGKNACETNARIDKQTSADFKVIDGKKWEFDIREKWAK
tara:strand:+ start:163 stop:315 length:153 start_codon:yes stop_codon:yes gene_type:complete